MNFEIVIARQFERKFKRLAKKYNSLSEDLGNLLELIESKPSIVDEIIRIAIKFD